MTDLLSSAGSVCGTPTAMSDTSSANFASDLQDYFTSLAKYSSTPLSALTAMAKEHYNVTSTPMSHPIIDRFQSFHFSPQAKQQDTRMPMETQTNGESAVCRYVRSQLALPEPLDVRITGEATSSKDREHAKKLSRICASIDLATAHTFGPYAAKIGKSREHLNSDLCLKVSCVFSW